MAALTGPQTAVQTMTEAFDERRRIIVEELNSIPGFSCVNPGGAFYTFPNISGTGMTARQAQDGLLEEVGVATVAGTSFGEYGEGFLRFSYANSVENIREALQRIRVWLQAR
jgi:aspartate aminotransferase